MHVGMIVVTGIVRVAMSKDGAGEEVLGEVEVVDGSERMVGCARSFLDQSFADKNKIKPASSTVKKVT